MKLLAGIFASVISIAGTSFADDLTAAELLEFCMSKDPVVNTACRFFVLGSVNGLSLGSGSERDANGRIRQNGKDFFCVPVGVSQYTLASTFVDTAKLLAAKYPDDLKSPAVSIVSVAMISAYPCRRPKQ
jgi:hypothetical protein